MLQSERGASAVLVGIMIVPLIGCLAIALDVGALYVERGQLQNGADAAALAVAQNCAGDGVCDNAWSQAASFANANANDGAANTLAPSFPNAHTVVITDSTRVAGTDAPAIYHPFAAVLGIDSTTVRASATAEWGPPKASAVVLPIALSFCEFRPTLDGTLQLIRYDTNVSCKGRDGHPIPGGFGWLERVSGLCEAFVDLDDATAPSEPGNSYPGVCDPGMAELAGKTILIPIFDGADVVSGPAKWYHIYAFAAFTVTGWKFSGGNKMPTVDLDPAAPHCTGNCRGIQGYFDHWVSVDAAAVELGGPDLGASIARLKN
ncbi:pilus assembly protein TadG-related protein [Luethyella okanaganae]|uniref:Pilus assembly protein TadG-related protein n=1 Tax=Luethyella okanaganae TaxID=69372 RepID=A0ABW1VEX8_9MICO